MNGTKVSCWLGCVCFLVTNLYAQTIEQRPIAFAQTEEIGLLGGGGAVLEEECSATETSPGCSDETKTISELYLAENLLYGTMSTDESEDRSEWRRTYDGSLQNMIPEWLDPFEFILEAREAYHRVSCIDARFVKVTFDPLNLQWRLALKLEPTDTDPALIAP